MGVEIRLYTLTSIFMLAFLMGAIFDDVKNRTFIKFLILLLISDILMLVSEAAVAFSYQYDLHTGWVSLFKFIHYISGTSVVVFYSYCLMSLMKEKDSNVKFIFSHITAIICSFFMLFIVISGITGELLDFNNEGAIINTSLDVVGRIVIVSAMILMVSGAIRYCRYMGGGLTFSVFVLSILPTISVTMKSLGYSLSHLIVTAFSTILIYMAYHRITYQKYILREKQLADSRISAMVNQIHPHFIFNALTAIKHLCKTDPERAQETVENFAFFLRGSLDALTDSKCVAFEHEMEITNNFLYVQKQRFGDKLKIVWDVKEKNFFIPVLTVQPLVENAIRHGIRQRVEGGTVTVSVFDAGDYYAVRVEDDGVGFDVNAHIDDGKVHVGIENVRNRLSHMSNGELIINSTPGVGTVAEIRIPKKISKGKRK